jgi:hypothetical protein
VQANQKIEMDRALKAAAESGGKAAAPPPPPPPTLMQTVRSLTPAYGEIGCE